MKTTHFFAVVILVVLAGIAGGLLVMQKKFQIQNKIEPPQDSQPAVTTATQLIDVPAAEIKRDVLSARDISTRDISTWPTYSFKELGFSMRLPFSESAITTRYYDCSKVYEAPCDNLETYWFQGVLNYKESGYPFIGSISENFEIGSEYQIIYIRSLLKNNGAYEVVGPPAFRFQITPLKVFEKEGATIVLFDPNEDYYKKSNDTVEQEWYARNVSRRVAAVIELPVNEKFKAAMLFFEEKDLTFDRLVQALQTIEFQQ